MCVCVCVCVCACVCVCVCTCVCVCVHECMHVYMYVHVHSHFILVYLQVTCTWVHKFALLWRDNGVDAMLTMPCTPAYAQDFEISK